MPETAGAAPMVVVGGGLTGGNAAVTLREEGYRGGVVLISQEPGVPFGRPPMSKTYLRSEEDLTGWYVRPADWYKQHEVELLPGRVSDIDAATHILRLDSGQELDYDKVVLATGGQNRRLKVPGADLAGIHYLRTEAECDAIKAEVGEHRRAVIVGMGFIGCEVAASLTQLGVQVTTVFPGRVPLENALGPEIGELIAGFHRSHGVELLAGEQVSGFEGTERVTAVLTASGKRLPCDFVVAGVGIAPDVSAISRSNISVENGILVDERCRTSAADVFAAGDVANQLHPLFGRVRVEHYNNAEKMGRAVARSMLGSESPYDYIHTFWSDQFEHHLEYAGHAVKWDDFVVRGSIVEGKLIGFYLLDGVVLAAAGLDRGGDPEGEPDSEMAAAARMVAMRARPIPGSLSDDRFDLWSLTPSS